MVNQHKLVLNKMRTITKSVVCYNVRQKPRRRRTPVSCICGIHWPSHATFSTKRFFCLFVCVGFFFAISIASILAIFQLCLERASYSIITQTCLCNMQQLLKVVKMIILDENFLILLKT